MTPKQKAKELYEKYEFTVDNYAPMIKNNSYLQELKHQVLCDTCEVLIEHCKRTNPYEIPFWENVMSELSFILEL